MARYDPIRPDLPGADERYITYSKIRIHIYSIVAYTFLATLSTAFACLNLGIRVRLNLPIDNPPPFLTGSGLDRARSVCTFAACLGLTGLFVAITQAGRSFRDWRVQCREYRDRAAYIHNVGIGASPMIPVIARDEFWSASVTIANLYFAGLLASAGILAWWAT